MSGWSRRLYDQYQRTSEFRLPPSGRDNGVPADTWVVLTDLASTDVTEVLALLAHSGVGGYAARQGQSGNGDAAVTHRLWVDVAQRLRAEEVLMGFMRNHRSAEQMPLPKPKPRERRPRGRRPESRSGATAPKITRHSAAGWIGRYSLAGLLAIALLLSVDRGTTTPLNCLLAFTTGAALMAMGHIGTSVRTRLTNRAVARRAEAHRRRR
ncbi:hypothetical protein [Mycobacterium aquaticum]|uniref:Uncharacterized protein n=1 Tax=Mycobacterium aquaticum TaxID=1927124 RepID=A0A1X0AS02_9MYCO|nr:hypothetical protein [Mycobacterium aquaticum]ORA32841.1 hypothetical protein BST13_21310 [Mycobacterium aquaticum]